MLKRKLTIGWLVRWSKAGCASMRSPPSTMIAALDRDALAAGVAGRQQVDVARALARRAMPELELRGPAEDLLQPLRILQARHLDEDAVGALALDVGSVVPSASTRRRITSIACSAARRTRSLTPASVKVSWTRPSGLLGDVDVAVAGLAEDRRSRSAATARAASAASRSRSAASGDADLDAARQRLDAALERRPAVSRRTRRTSSRSWTSSGCAGDPA